MFDWLPDPTFHHGGVPFRVLPAENQNFLAVRLADRAGPTHRYKIRTSLWSFPFFFFSLHVDNTSVRGTLPAHSKAPQAFITWNIANLLQGESFL